MGNVFNAVVTVPVWFVSILAVMGIAIGILIAIYGRYIVPVRSGSKEPKKDKVIARSASGTIRKVAPSVPPLPVFNDGSQLSITGPGKIDLERCATQRINYRISDAANLLGTTINTIGKLVADGNLKAVITGDGIRWIRSDSIVDLLQRIGIDADPENQGHEEVETSAPTSPPQRANGAPVVGTVLPKIESKAASKPEPKVEPKPEPKVEPKPEPKIIPPEPLLVKQPHRQVYWYFVDGEEKGYATLRDAAAAIGFIADPKSIVDWNKIPSDVQSRIQRAKITEFLASKTL